MSASAIIKEAISDGVNLVLTERGTIKVSGEKSAVHRWTPIIKMHKPEIIETLAANDLHIPDDLEHLIRRAGTYWEYSPDDYDLVRNLARRDPDGLRRALESDKWLAMVEHESFEERAAIMEYDGGLTRDEAERRATLPINTREYGKGA